MAGHSRPVVIAHVSRPQSRAGHRALAAYPPGAAWLYLGQDPVAARAWQAVLGERFIRLETGRRLDQVAAALRRPFLEWLEDLRRRYQRDQTWWLTRLAERNTLVSPLFLRVCYLETARRCLVEEPELACIVAESWGLVAALRGVVGAAGLAPHSPAPWRAYLARAREVARGAAMPVYFLLRCLKRRAAALATGRARGFPAAPPGQGRLVISTYVHPANLTPDGVFHDRYFPGLREWLEREGFDPWVLASLAATDLPALEAYRWMRASRSRFLVPDDWLTVADYVGAVKSALGSRRFRPPAVVAGLDIGPLVAEERRGQGGARAPFEAALLRRLPPRLARAGLAPRQLIAWSENQLQDKALIQGWRAAFPGAPCVAVQNTPLYANVLNMFPTAGECEAGVTADLVVCSGPLPASILSRESGRRLRTRVGCALRYEYLHRPSSVTVRPASAGETKAILVALPVTPNAAASFLDLIDAVIRARSSWRWLVKPHPDYTLEEVERLTGWTVSGRGCTVVGGSLAQCFEQVDAVVAAGSGTALEAVAFGLPLVLVGNSTALSLNPLEWFGPEVSPVCYSAAEIDAELIRQLERAAGAEADSGRRRHVLDAWFAPVTDDALRQFIV